MAVAPDLETAHAPELVEETPRRSWATRLRVITPLAVVYVIWGSTYFSIRLAIDTIPPFLQAGLRFVFAGAVLYVLSALRAAPGNRLPSLRTWFAAAVTGIALLVIGNGGVSWAEQYVTTGTTALIIATVPLWMAVLGWLAWRRRLHPLSIAGIVLGFVGMALLAGPALGGIRSSTIGLVVLFLSALSWAAGSLYARGAAVPASPAMGTAMQMLIAGSLLTVVSFVSGDAFKLHLDRVTWSSAAAFVYLVLFGSLVAYSCYAWLLRNADLTLVSTYAYVNPVVAIVLGTVFLGEHLTVRTLVAAAVILVAVAAIVSRQNAHD